MKKRLLFIGILLSTLLTGCSSMTGVFGPNSIRDVKASAKVTEAQEALYLNDISKLEQVAQLSFGVDYSLNLTPKDYSNIKIAKELNSRVLNISGLPPLEEQKAMIILVGDLISTNLNILKEGTDKLLLLDRQIINLQNDKKSLEQDKSKAIADFINLASKTALKTDTLSSELNSYTSYWGLGGIVMGTVSLSKHLFWTILICSIIYIILRTAAKFYPPAAIIWTVFSQIGAVLITAIEAILPKAINSLGLVASEVHTDVVNELSILKNSVVAAAVAPMAIVPPTVPLTTSTTGSI